LTLRRPSLPGWTHSLQFRLTAGFAAVLALAIAGISAYAAVATRAETQKFAQDLDESRAMRIERVAEQAYEANRNWEQVQFAMGQAAALLGSRVVILSPDGQVIVDSHQSVQPLDERVAAQRGSFPQRRVHRRPFIVGNEQLGVMVFVEEDLAPPPWLQFFDSSLLVLTPSAGQPGQQTVGSVPVEGDRSAQAPTIEDRIEEIAEPRLSQLESSFQRSLIWAGVGAGAAGILLVTAFTRQAISPVRGLTVAARSLGKGDLSYRVPETRRDEVGELAHTFNEMAAGLQQLAKQRKAMTADVAHELRTPLTNIRGYLEAIKDGVLQPDAATISIIHEQAAHLSRLVEDLRLLAIADAGRLELTLGPERLDLLAEDAVAAFRPRASESGTSLLVVASPGLQPLQLDRTRMRQVVANLVENALTHTPAGGRVTVEVEDAGERQRLTVADTGRGIPRDQLDRIFEQFYRVDPSRTRSTGGAGLGLTIVKRLVEAHGGKIWAESEEGSGARFIIELPKAAPLPAAS